MSDSDIVNPSTTGLGRRAARGAAQTGLGQIARILVQTASVVVLARLLTPNDYGLFAMVMTLAGVAEIFRDFGLSSAAIQAPVLTHHQRDNLFWLNAAVGVALMGLVFAAAPLIAALFGRSELVGLTHLVSVVFLINGLATQHRASLARELRFSALAVIDVVGPATGLLVGIGAALLGLGYWALAAQQIAQAVALLLLITIAARWWPGRPRRNVPVRDLVRFGGNMVAAQLVGYLGNNADNLVIGTRFGSVALGFYSRAFQLLMTPLNQFRVPITAVAVPVLSRLQDERERYAEFVHRGQVALGYTMVAGLGLVMSASEPITLILFGERWRSIAPLLALLAFAAVFQTLAYVGYWVYVSRGLTNRLFRYTLITVTIKITMILLGSIWGVLGVAVGYAIAPAVSWPISLWWLSRNTPMPVRRLVTGVLRITAVTGTGVVLAHLAVLETAALGSVVQLAAAVLVTLAVYALLALVVPAVRRDLAELVATARLVRSQAR